jgi:RNA recognition motif-containing protein
MPAASCSPPAAQSSSGVGSSASSGCSSSTGPVSSSSAVNSTGVSNTITSSSSAQFASTGVSAHSTGASPPNSVSGKPNGSDPTVSLIVNNNNSDNNNVSHAASLRNHISSGHDSSRSNGSNLGNEQLSRTNLYIKGLSPETTDKILFELCSPYVFNTLLYDQL